MIALLEKLFTRKMLQKIEYELRNKGPQRKKFIYIQEKYKKELGIQKEWRRI